MQGPRVTNYNFQHGFKEQKYEVTIGHIFENISS